MQTSKPNGVNNFIYKSNIWASNYRTYFINCGSLLNMHMQ